MTLIFLVKKLQNTLDKFTIFETIFFLFCFDALCLSHSIHTIAKLCLVCVYGAENLVIAKLHISTEILMNSVFFSTAFIESTVKMYDFILARNQIPESRQSIVYLEPHSYCFNTKCRFSNGKPDFYPLEMCSMRRASLLSSVSNFITENVSAKYMWNDRKNTLAGSQWQTP